MREITETEERLLAALEPFRDVFRREGFQDGRQQGIVSLYSSIINWSVRGENREITDEERTKRIMDTKDLCEFLERSNPVLREHFHETP